jgi:hypothetical protein
LVLIVCLRRSPRCGSGTPGHALFWGGGGAPGPFLRASVRRRPPPAMPGKLAAEIERALHRSPWWQVIMAVRPPPRRVASVRLQHGTPQPIPRPSRRSPLRRHGSSPAPWRRVPPSPRAWPGMDTNLGNGPFRARSPGHRSRGGLAHRSSRVVACAIAHCVRPGIWPASRFATNFLKRFF